MTAVWIKNNMIPNGNVEDKLITPHIKSISDMRIRDLIGTYFYKYLLVKFNAKTLTVDEELLVEEIKYAIGYGVVAELYASTSAQLQNKGPQKQSGEFSQPNDFKEISYQIKFNTDKGRFYEMRIAEFLKEHKDDYPQFIDKLNKDSAILKSCCKGLDRYESQVYFM